jgi:exopolysaccharide production protein ExoY
MQEDDKVQVAGPFMYDLDKTTISGPYRNNVTPIDTRSGANIQSRPIGGNLKRSLDVLIGLGVLIFFAPLMITLALIIWVQRDGPILYRQTRIGFEGRSFGCLKFRSMVADSKLRLEQFLEANPSAKAEWLATHKLRRDPRITPFGRFLRKSSLDELPQLFNIIWGDMSLVGPRPIVADEVTHYGDSFVSYMQSRPGLTGLWQISGRSETSYSERVALDVKYVSEWRIYEDVSIILKTIPAVLTSRGSY